MELQPEKDREASWVLLEGAWPSVRVWPPVAVVPGDLVCWASNETFVDFPSLSVNCLFPLNGVIPTSRGQRFLLSLMIFCSFAAILEYLSGLTK